MSKNLKTTLSALFVGLFLMGIAVMPFSPLVSKAHAGGYYRAYARTYYTTPIWYTFDAPYGYYCSTPYYWSTYYNDWHHVPSYAYWHGDYPTVIGISLFWIGGAKLSPSPSTFIAYCY